MKKRKTLIIIFIIVLLIAVAVYLFINKDYNKITLNEKNWINANSKKINDIYVKNDLNVFSAKGNGIFFEFINDFSKEMDLTINPITISNNSNNEGVGLLNGNDINKTDRIIYTDHYILVGLKNFNYLSINDIENKKIGVIKTSKKYIEKSLNNKES